MIDPSWNRKASNVTERLKILILDGAGNSNPIYTTWIPKCPLKCEVWDPEIATPSVVPPDCGLVVAHDQFREPIASALMTLMEQNRTPVLILADGILEFRNTWCNPRIAAGSVYQPVLGHKMACIGPNQARIIESWGNIGKCENVGMPRLDCMTSRQPRPRRNDQNFRLLITTANTPGFTNRQVEIARDSLICLKKSIDEFNASNDLGITPVWRVSKSLAGDLRSHSIEVCNADCPLDVALQDVDALISTPSTCLLEGMLQGIPVATLNFWNEPTYVPSAWTITSAQCIKKTLSELISPPSAKMLFQQFCLADSLRADGQATDRLIQLMLEMVNIGKRHAAEGAPLVFPGKLIDDESTPVSATEFKLDLKKMFSNDKYYGRLKKSDQPWLLLEHKSLHNKELLNENSQLRLANFELQQLLSAAEFELNQTKTSRSYKLGKLLTTPFKRLIKSTDSNK